jgi:hypothetical protein
MQPLLHLFFVGLRSLALKAVPEGILYKLSWLRCSSSLYSVPKFLFASYFPPYPVILGGLKRTRPQPGIPIIFIGSH